MSEKEIFQTIADALKNRQPRALVTVIQTSGSVPRDVGARMLVAPDGQIWGTIGGGKMESLIIAEAQRVLQSGQPGQFEYPLHEGDEKSFGAICGGSVTVFIEPMGLTTRLIMAGSGHCSQALAKAALGLGWCVEVVEDRPSLLNEAHFPPEVTMHESDDAIAALRNLSLDKQTAVCLLNRNPQLDRDGLRVILKNAEWAEDTASDSITEDGSAAKPVSPFYIGMIGSNKKVNTVMKELRDAGIAEDKLAAVCSPIGLEIYAESPEEIAISILAEIIRAWHLAQPTSTRTRSAKSKPAS
jgi:xanthine dehydrogenase accessory factor